MDAATVEGTLRIGRDARKVETTAVRGSATIPQKPLGETAEVLMVLMTPAVDSPSVPSDGTEIRSPAFCSRMRIGRWPPRLSLLIAHARRSE